MPVDEGNGLDAVNERSEDTRWSITEDPGAVPRSREAAIFLELQNDDSPPKLIARTVFDPSSR